MSAIRLLPRCFLSLFTIVLAAVGCQAAERTVSTTEELRAALSDVTVVEVRLVNNITLLSNWPAGGSEITTEKKLVGDIEQCGGLCNINIAADRFFARRFLYVSKGGTLRARNLRIRDGYLELTSELVGGSVGAAVLVERAEAHFEDCTFTANTVVSGWGGAVFTDSSTASFRQCVFEQNYAERGGAVRMRGDRERNTEAVFSGCTFQFNQAASGGGVDVGYRSDALFQNCTFQYNTAEKEGGAVSLQYGKATFQNYLFNENQGKDGANAYVVDGSAGFYPGISLEDQGWSAAGSGQIYEWFPPPISPPAPPSPPPPPPPPPPPTPPPLPTRAPTAVPIIFPEEPSKGRSDQTMIIVGAALGGLLVGACMVWRIRKRRQMVKAARLDARGNLDPFKAAPHPFFGGQKTAAKQPARAAPNVEGDFALQYQQAQQPLRAAPNVDPDQALHHPLPDSSSGARKGLFRDSGLRNSSDLGSSGLVSSSGTLGGTRNSGAALAALGASLGGQRGSGAALAALGGAPPGPPPQGPGPRSSGDPAISMDDLDFDALSGQSARLSASSLGRTSGVRSSGVGLSQTMHSIQEGSEGMTPPPPDGSRGGKLAPLGGAGEELQAPRTPPRGEGGPESSYQGRTAAEVAGDIDAWDQMAAGRGGANRAGGVEELSWLTGPWGPGGRVAGSGQGSQEAGGAGAAGGLGAAAGPAGASPGRVGIGRAPPQEMDPFDFGLQAAGPAHSSRTRASADLDVEDDEGGEEVL